MKDFYNKLGKCWLAATNEEDRKMWEERMNHVWKMFTPEEKKEMLVEAKIELTKAFDKAFENSFKNKL